MAADNKSQNEQLKRLIEALGTVAEMSLVFYRDVLQAGATYEEALKLTQAFIAANIFGSGAGKDKAGS